MSKETEKRQAGSTSIVWGCSSLVPWCSLLPPLSAQNSRKERATEGLANIGKIPLVTFYKFLLLHFGKIVRRYYGGVA